MIASPIKIAFARQRINGRQMVSYMGASILLSEKTLSGILSAVTERVLVFTHTHLILYENA